MCIEQNDEYRIFDRSLYQRQFGVWRQVMRFNRDLKLDEAVREYEGEDDAQSA